MLPNKLSLATAFLVLRDSGSNSGFNSRYAGDTRRAVNGLVADADGFIDIRPNATLPVADDYVYNLPRFNPKRPVAFYLPQDCSPTPLGVFKTYFSRDIMELIARYFDHIYDVYSHCNDYLVVQPMPMPKLTRTKNTLIPT